MAKTKTAAKPNTTPKRKTVKPQSKTPPKKTTAKPKEIAYSPNLKCSFCGEPSKNARRLIALDPPSKICICDECVEVCVKILLDEIPLERINRINRLFAMQVEKSKMLFEQKHTKQETKKKVKNSNA